MIKSKKGLLVVLSGPSGVGKGTVCKKLTEENDNLFLSISATTRSPRTGEVDGQNYYFYDQDTFQSMIQEESFFEWAEFCDHYYGTPKKPVLSMLEQGKDVILEIDVQGALNVKKTYPEGVLIFLLPPSLEELRNRITGRGTETELVIEKRMHAALSELAQAKEYHYLIVNDSVEEAARKIHAVITSEKARTSRLDLSDLDQIEQY